MTVRQHRGMTLYGMPDTAALSQVVTELTRPHTRTVGDQCGVEPPLLALLEVAIKSDTSGASGGGGASRTGAPVDVNALSIWQGIGQCVGEYWPGRGDLAQAKTHLIVRLQRWTEQVAGTDNEVHLLEMCEYWRGQIRELLEPPKRVPVRGGQCPRCHANQVLGTDPDGQRVYQPCLLAHLSEDPVRVECLACGGTWYSLDMLELEVDFAG